jgi:hypothetical protein
VRPLPACAMAAVEPARAVAAPRRVTCARAGAARRGRPSQGNAAVRAAAERWGGAAGGRPCSLEELLAGGSAAAAGREAAPGREG